MKVPLGKIDAITTTKTHAVAFTNLMSMVASLVWAGLAGAMQRRAWRRFKAKSELVGTGAAERIRTSDPRITNALLYRLSYRGLSAFLTPCAGRLLPALE